MTALEVRRAGLRGRWWILAIGCLTGAVLLGVAVGPVSLGLGAVAGEFVDRLPFVHHSSGLNEQQSAILWQLRVPRVVLAGLVGAMLALAGAAYQGVFRNPLADP